MPLRHMSSTSLSSTRVALFGAPAAAGGWIARRVTPDHIVSLEPNEIFVFGSNASGFHAGGAAADAMQRFGAVWGQGEGLQGRSYAISTMEGLDNMRAAIDRFVQFASQHPESRFLVTRIGCGIAGHSVREVAPLFSGCASRTSPCLPTSGTFSASRCNKRWQSLRLPFPVVSLVSMEVGEIEKIASRRKKYIKTLVFHWKKCTFAAKSRWEKCNELIRSRSKKC